MNPCRKHEAQDVHESGAGYLCRICEIERLSAEYSDLRELAAEFVEAWLGDGDGTDFDGLAARIAKALDSGTESPK